MIMIEESQWDSAIFYYCRDHLDVDHVMKVSLVISL